MSRTTKRPYTDSRRHSRSCRNHGPCGVCVGNRTVQSLRERVRVEQQVTDALSDLHARLLASAKPLDADAARILHENAWELYA